MRTMTMAEMSGTSRVQATWRCEEDMKEGRELAR